MIAYGSGPTIAPFPRWAGIGQLSMGLVQAWPNTITGVRFGELTIMLELFSWIENLIEEQAPSRVVVGNIQCSTAWFIELRIKNAFFLNYPKIAF